MVIFYQILLGGYQIFCTVLFGKFGFFLGVIGVILWTLTQTSGKLRTLQIFIQIMISFGIYKILFSKSSNEDKKE